jgi:phage/plasmid-associated DNA primase
MRWNANQADTWPSPREAADRRRHRDGEVFLHREFFSFRPAFKIWLSTNNLPRISETSHAMWRRVRLVPFTVTIPDDQQDKSLRQKFAAELPGILAWIVRGCLLWQAEGLGMPQAVRGATENYRQDSDRLREFFDERCIVEPAASVSSKELYEAYTEWTREAGERELSKAAIGLLLAERGFAAVRVAAQRRWKGLRLRTPLDVDDDPQSRGEADEVNDPHAKGGQSPDAQGVIVDLCEG